MNFRSLFTRIPLVAVLFVSSVTFAVKVPTSTPNFDLNLAFLLQARAQAAFDGDPSAGAGAGPGAAPYGTFDTDFYIRRMRLIASGYAFQKFSFYLMFDTPNFGIRGNYTGSTFVQDMHIGYEPFKELAIEAGFIYMPFNYLGLLASSATSSIEKGTAILFYNNSRGLRETGIQLRTLILDKRLYFRGGVFEGLKGRQTNQNGAAVATTDAPGGNPSTVNGNGRPLFAGTLRFNLIGGENAYSFPSLYLDGNSHVSIGVAGQFQNKGSNTPITRVGPTGARTTTNTAVNDYLAYTGDVFADFALPGDMEAVLMVDAERFDWGSGSDKTGNGLYAEAGFRVGSFEPEVNGYWFNSDSKQNSFLKYAGGINWFISRHNTKLSLEFISQKNAVNLDAATSVHLFLAQFQFFY
jgi:phosphate-selective porin O/P